MKYEIGMLLKYNRTGQLYQIVGIDNHIKVRVARIVDSTTTPMTKQSFDWTYRITDVDRFFNEAAI